MKIIFTGIQGCGKGTQSRILEQKYGFKILEMGEEFRKVIRSGSELGNQIKAIIDTGRQVPEELGKEVMKQILIENKDIENIIFDGFIRNEWNLKVFNEYVKDYKVILFELDLNKAKKRLYSRMYDPETGETFPGDFEVNPKTGNKLTRREDDKDIESIKRRFNEFVEKTLPIIEQQQKLGIVYEIEANQPIEDVTKEIEEKLGLN